MQILITTIVLVALAWAYWTGRTVADWRVSDNDPQRRAWRVWVWPATAIIWVFLTSSIKVATVINNRLPGGSSQDDVPADDEDIPL